MKKTLLLFTLCLLSVSAAKAQCTSGATSYDLTVSGNIVLPPSGPSFSMGIICAGGHLMDSSMCCTRFIHIEGGGVYEAGPAAYGFVFIKNGGVFDAHGNSSFFGVSYEAGATILNYTGPMTFCPVVTFPPGACTPTGIEEQGPLGLKTYPNPSKDILYLENNFSKDAVITVYDIAGKKMMELASFGNELNVSSLPSGMYMFMITLEGEKVAYSKFAVVR
jgi:hypothetical protein